MEALSDSQVLLLAARLVAASELRSFLSLAASRQDILSTELIYRILITYLPLETGTNFLNDVRDLLNHIDANFAEYSNLDHDGEIAHALELDDTYSEQALTGLLLESIPSYSDGQSILTSFLVAWTRKLESIGDIPGHVTGFVSTLAAGRPILQNWLSTYLQPLVRLQTHYPDRAQDLNIGAIEHAHGFEGVKILMQFATEDGDSGHVGRDLEEIVSPWVRGSTRNKRRRVSPDDFEDDRSSAEWSDINQWLLLTAQTQPHTAYKAAQQWAGPSGSGQDVEMDDLFEEASSSETDYVQAVIALIYCVSDGTAGFSLQVGQSLLSRAAELAQLFQPDFGDSFPNLTQFEILRNVSRADLLDNNLLNKDNALTRPSTNLVDFLYGILSTQKLLEKYKLSTPTRLIVTKVLFDSEENQKQELRNLLAQVPRSIHSHPMWNMTRRELLWLRSWSLTSLHNEAASSFGYFSKIQPDYLESSILEAILEACTYDTVKNIYLESEDLPLALDKVEEVVLAAVDSAYDNATNGNRTRGNAKRASDILKNFRPYFTESTRFSELEHLLQAAHSLSFYHLTLQHGVPFIPVNIRASADPLSFISRVLEQNSDAYTQLDDLLGIARNLVLAGLPTPMIDKDSYPGYTRSSDQTLIAVERHITYLAITSALSHHDFDTANSYITIRLNIPNSSGSKELVSDDLSWRAVFAAGKYQPPVSGSHQSLTAQISSLRKRMDLLSQALLLAPSTALPSILTSWSEQETLLAQLGSKAQATEHAIDKNKQNLVTFPNTNAGLPGGFGISDTDADAAENASWKANRSDLAFSNMTRLDTPSGYDEEAPMGLFDVTRAAATAMSKNFPLRVKQRQQQQGRAPGFTSSRPVSGTFSGDTSEGEMGDSVGSLERPGSAGGTHSMRKRDRISAAVTGGLVSGMSWVLGAKPIEESAGGRET